MSDRIYIYQECMFACNLVLLYKLRYQSRSRPRTSCAAELDGDAWVRVLHQHLRVLRKPLTSSRGALHAALAITLTARLDPDNAVNERVVDSSTGLDTEASGSYITPFTPEIVSISQLRTTTSQTMQKGLKLSGRQPGQEVGRDRGDIPFFPRTG